MTHATGAGPSSTRQTADRTRQLTPLELISAALVAATFVWSAARAVAYVWRSTFMSVMAWDDEGYLLVSVREFLFGRALYDEVFSQYGPAYYAFKQVLSLVHGVPTYDVTRWTTVAIWLLSATLLGFAALRLTRSVVAGLGAAFILVPALSALPNEPGHPQELLVLLIALSVAVAASPLPRLSHLVALTAITSVAFLTKINVGIFMGLAVLAAAVPVPPGVARTVMAVLLAALPAVLMSRHLSDGAWKYAAVCGAGVLTSVVMNRAPRWSPGRSVLLILAVGMLPALVLVLYLLARDSSLAGIVDAVLIRPLQLSDVYVVPLDVRRYHVLASISVASLAVLMSLRPSARFTWLQPMIPAIKILTGLYVIVWLGPNRTGVVVQSALVAFVLLLPDQRTRTDDSFGRIFLASSAAWHACTAYPVAGSQISWSSFLVTLGACVCLWDGLAGSRTIIAARRGWQRLATTAILCGVWLFCDRTLTPLAAVEAVYESHSPLPYDGATSTRADPTQLAEFNWVVANLQAHCSDFVTLPGYNRFHLWSGLRPVTGYNTTSWMFLLKDDEQRTIVERMRQSPRPCALYHEAGVATWTSRPIADRPLAAYVLGLSPVARRHGLDLRVPAIHATDWTFEYVLAGSRTFDGNQSYLALPELITGSPTGTVRLWFRTRQAGAIVGLQSAWPPATPTAWCPVIYIGRDGHLRAGLGTGEAKPLTTPVRVDDAEWHHVALVFQPAHQLLFVDGTLVTERLGSIDVSWATSLQVGTAFTASWPEGNGSWFPFVGDVRDVIADADAWTSTEVERDFARTRSSAR